MLTMKEFHYEVIQPVRSPIFGFGVEEISQIRAPLKNHQIALAQKKVVELSECNFIWRLNGVN